VEPDAGILGRRTTIVLDPRGQDDHETALLKELKPLVDELSQLRLVRLDALLETLVIRAGHWVLRSQTRTRHRSQEV
jgi:hypothetical protein